MEYKHTDSKIILECNKQGVVTQIYLDSGSILDNIKLPIGLHSLVLPDSIDELGKFWLSIQEKSMEENIVLNINHNDKHIKFICSGYVLYDKVLICGKTELTATEKALEEIMRINNEQTNHIRLLEKKVLMMQEDSKKTEINEAFLNDFTSLNNELVNNQRELIQKNRKIEFLNMELTAINEHMTMFTYSISHDLKEPMRMVKSFLTLLNKKYGNSLDEDGRIYMDFALDGANRLSKMLADLLVYHQSSNISTTDTVNLNEVLGEVKKILKKEIEEQNAQITSENLPIIKGSSTGLLQVFQNLISNAIKFVPEDVNPLVSITVEETETDFTFAIKDNGIGFKENQIKDVFKLFKRFNPQQQYEGTGMGLALVKKTIERMGGSIWLESEFGKGSTFFVTLKKGPISQQ